MSKDSLTGILCICAVLVFSGCSVRSVKTYSVEKPRVDLTVEGNEGFIYGKPPADSDLLKPDPRRRPLSNNRTISVLEVNIEDKEQEEADSAEEMPQKSSRTLKKARVSGDRYRPPVQTNIVPKSKESEYTFYKVQKGDTLQKISRKFYNTTKKWNLIFNENKDKFSTPGKIYPGQVIRVPKITEISKSATASSVSRSGEYSLYTVQKGDTLQKISKKYYNTTRKWLLLFTENQDVLTEHGRIFPGQVLKIPKNP